MRSLSVLLFENDAVAAGEMESGLRNSGYSSIVTVSGDSDGLIRIIETRPDVVLVNVSNGSKYGGIDYASEISSRSGVPVVLISDSSDDETVRRITQANPSGYVLKPFSIGSLDMAIRMAMSRHEIEKRYRESISQTASVLDSISDAVILADREYRITMMNPLAVSLTGFTLEKALGRPVDNIVSLRNERTGYVIMPESLKKGEPCVLLSRDGKKTHVNGSYRPVRDEKGRTTGAVLVLREEDSRRLQIDRLLKKEERYRKLFEHMSNGVFILEAEKDNNDFIIKDCNSSAEKHNGVRKNDILGKRLIEVFPALKGKDLLEWHHIVQRTGGELYRSGVSYSMGEKKTRRDYTIYKLPSGEIVSMFKDESRLADAEMALLESEREKNTILNSMSELVLYIDREKKLRWMNSTARKYLGVKGKEVRGLFCQEMPWCHSHGSYQCAAFYSLDTGRPSREEFLSPEGRWMRIKTSPVLDESSRVTGVVEIVEDITEKRIADKALEESQKRFELILNGGNIGYWDWDMTTGHITHNSRWATMLGYHPDDIDPVLDSWTKRIHPHDYNRAISIIDDHINNESPYFETEYRMATRSGQWKWFFSSGMVMERGRNREPLRISGILIDINDLKKAEEEVSRLNEELEKRVALRTRELEEVNAELKDFAYVVSHDLKAPLRGINQLATWLKSDYYEVLDSEGQEQMDLLIGRVKRMNRLIDGILQYSSVGRTDESAEKVDCNVLVRDLSSMLLHGSNTTITISNELPVLFVDRFRIEQVFQNLLSNAIRYMDKDEGRIEVSVRDHVYSWEFCVSDDGPGIDPRYHDKIFQIFQTLVPKDEYESTGIGLSLVKKIVNIFGGDVRIESEVGNGSKFYFTIPKGTAALAEQ